MNATTREQTDVANWLAGLGEPTRLMILKTLATGSKNVTELARILNVEIVNVSHHLGVLRQNKIVLDEKQGRFVIYRLAEGIEVKDQTLVLTHVASKTVLTIPLH